MNRFIVITVLATTALCLAQEEHYTDRFDGVNVDEITANRRLLVPYVRCVLDQGRCTAEGKELKLHVKDAMQTACKKCTDKQKEGARKVVNHIREKELEYWEQLIAKYDPTGEYKPIYEPFLAGVEPTEINIANNSTEATDVQTTDLVGEINPNEPVPIEQKNADLVETIKTESLEIKKAESVQDTKTDLIHE
ncbi:unnamed protein product [Diatraea saccharalis]|uniref:Uncharacterized protein n=1 Tax=Diatraea saccharalis TaxID=40085 RepID=A0A9N9WKZ8_9NEOP|nr:unnamed protein product [Diatraea saccharalis]